MEKLHSIKYNRIVITSGHVENKDAQLYYVLQSL
jgi:hypothetical protein